MGFHRALMQGQAGDSRPRPEGAPQVRTFGTSVLWLYSPAGDEMELKLDVTRTPRAEEIPMGMGCSMMIVAPAMDRVYELLALVVALYFPVAMVTWLVIDKLFISSSGKTRPVREEASGSSANSMLPDHGRRET